MVLKRKRSSSELSSPSSVSSFNSPPHGAAIRNPFATMDMTPIHLHSRTLKRFRNSRPSEEEVHLTHTSSAERTLNMLYSAQQQSAQHDDVLPILEQPQETTHPEANQQSLHRFWNISSAPVSTISYPVTQPASSCDGCGSGNSTRNADEMDVDGLQCGC
ncbi:hypothetical protein B0J13DRAFT_655358 [Dactylonectria estremocensis]|uniref:Uncharacterized protein n=1 Tax=Dactylonectria estremocensis TaxID=1079267 RepID=A0A9P9F9C0_9HYPO|nr:hypothetical protein B0J13DRAFT_655358 [Dactylonectria estremocensis]